MHLTRVSPKEGIFFALLGLTSIIAALTHWLLTNYHISFNGIPRYALPVNAVAAMIFATE
jgi:hypothetical protein